MSTDSLETPDEIYNEIVMIQQIQPDCTVLIVEGESDVGALESHLDLRVVHCLPCGGKDTAVDTIQIVDDEGVHGVLAIVDRDWDGLINASITSPNIVYTDFYDLDATIFFSRDILLRVISNFCDRKKARRHLRESSAASFADMLAAICMPIGILRYTSAKYNFNLALRKFPIHEVLDSSLTAVDPQKMMQVALSRSTGLSDDPESIKARFLLELSNVAEQPRFYCSGHDLHSALSALTSKKWGGAGGAKNLGNAIRSAFGFSELRETQMFRQASRWTERQRKVVWREHHDDISSMDTVA